MWAIVETWAVLRFFAQADPTSVAVGQLGIAGACVALVLAGYWDKRQENKELRAVIASEHADKEAWIVAQTRANDLILNATSALAASAQALDKVADSLARVPGEDTFVRLRVALERIEEADRSGGRDVPPAPR